MKSYVIMDPSTGQIVSAVRASEDQLPPEGDAPDGSGFQIIHGDGDADEHQIKNGRIRKKHWRTRQRQRDRAAWGKLRSERRARLEATDWTQMPDANLTEQERAAWAAYRAALRNLPRTTSDPTSPVWPEEPI